MAQHRVFPSLRPSSAPAFSSFRAASGLVILACGAILAGAYLLGMLGQVMVVQDTPRKADAIVVLSGGDWAIRLEQGIGLYMDGFAPVLILAGGGQEGRPSAAEVMKRQAIEMGVPASSVLLVDASASTREDALFTRELMARQGLGSAILVTSPYHQLRASLTFERAFEGSGVSLVNFPAHDGNWQPDGWWKTRSSFQLTIVELAKLAYYKLSGYL